MKSQATTIAGFLEEQPPVRKVALTKVRALIQKTAPGAAEAMQHGMITYDISRTHGRLGGRRRPKQPLFETI